MLQENTGSLPPKDEDSPSPVWEGEVLRGGVEIMLGLAVATKARAVYVRGYENWEITPINIATAEVDIKFRPAKLLEVHFLNGGSKRNKRGQARWNAVYEAEDKWTREHPEGPSLDLKIHFARDHFPEGSRIDWDRFAHDYGLKTDQHRKIWPLSPSSTRQQ